MYIFVLLHEIYNSKELSIHPFPSSPMCQSILNDPNTFNILEEEKEK